MIHSMSLQATRPYERLLTVRANKPPFASMRILVLNIVSHIIQICSIFGGRVDTAHRVKHLTYYRQSY